MPSLSDHIADLGADMMPFGPTGPDGAAVWVAQTFDALTGGFGPEYAALRSRVGIFHAAQRAVIELTGADRQDFLHRLTTQDINGLKGGDSVRAFVLDGKGKILADLTVHHGDLSTWVELDGFDEAAVRQLFEDKLFTEDVAIGAPKGGRECLWLLGPAGVALLKSMGADFIAERELEGQPAGKPGPGVANGLHHVVTIAETPVSVARIDEGSLMVLRVFVPEDRAARVYDALLDAAGFERPGESETDRAEQAERRRAGLRGAPVGWAAVNTARIEEGRPMYHIDFGPDAIPNETGLLDEAVSFTAGCYVGQEIVLRIRDLGRPKRMVVPLAFGEAAADVASAEADDHALPLAGAPLIKDESKDELKTDGEADSAADLAKPVKPIGAVTSSTPSPLKSQAGIGIGTVKWGNHRPGSKLRVGTDAGWYAAEVRTL